MECEFRDTPEAHHRLTVLVSDFLNRWQLREDSEVSVCQAVAAVQDVVRREIPAKVLFAEFDKDTSNQWLRFPYIGSNRSITHTIRLVQYHVCKVTVSDHSYKMHTELGLADWSDRQEPFCWIQYNFLQRAIMPSLFNMCIAGMLGVLAVDCLPYKKELLAGFVQIQAIVTGSRRGLPVSWALAFTVHTIVTSLFEVQGLGHFEFLATTARSTFETFFEQVRSVEIQRQSSIIPPTPIRDEYVKGLLALCHLVDVPMINMRIRDQSLLPVWNPYCAGAFLSYTAYYGNFDRGTSCLDSDAQLQVTLHLFNALKQTGEIRPGQIELLDLVFQMFEDCEAIWGKQLPRKGELLTRYYMAFGCQGGSRRLWSTLSKRKTRMRAVTPIFCETVSKSFSRICLDSDNGVVERRPGGRRQRNRRDTLYKLGVRANVALSAMSDDELLMATNFTSLGFFLHEFYIKLVVDLGLMALVEELVQQTRHRCRSEDDIYKLRHTCMTCLLGEVMLGPLDGGDTTLASKCAKSMTEYFNGIPHDAVFWFTPKSIGSAS